MNQIKEKRKRALQWSDEKSKLAQEGGWTKIVQEAWMQVEWRIRRNSTEYEVCRRISRYDPRFVCYPFPVLS